MLFPVVEFALGLTAASVGVGVLKAAIPAATGLALANALDRVHVLESLDLNAVRDMSSLSLELERRGIKLNSSTPSGVGLLSKPLVVPALHPSLTDFAGEWYVTDVEATMLIFFLGREQAKLGIGGPGKGFTYLSEKTGHPAKDLVTWFYNLGKVDVPDEHFSNGRLEAYLRYLKKVTVPARIEWLKQNQA